MKKANSISFAKMMGWFVAMALTLGVSVQSTAQCTLVCNNLVQVSLDEDCETELLPDMILEGDTPPGCPLGNLQVQIKVGNNWQPANGAGNAVVNASHINKTVQVRVRDNVSGQSCWGWIHVEDKLAPELDCNDITIPCAAASYTPQYLRGTLLLADAFPNQLPNSVLSFQGSNTWLVTAGDLDNCTTASLSYSDEWFDLPCGLTNGQDRSGYVRRTWSAVDQSGNVSTCTQFIYLQRYHVNQVLFPADVLNLDCSNGNTSPSNTGAPFITWNGINLPLFPDPTACELNVTYTDQRLDICDGSYKILRTWTVYDWCLPTSPFPPLTNPIYYIQVIKVSDTTGPEILSPDDLCGSTIEVSVDPFGCVANVDLPDVTVTDDCSRLKSIVAKWRVDDVWYSTTGFFSSFPGNNFWNPDTLGVVGVATNLPLGTHVVTYTITDDCGNTSTCTFRLRVEDQIPPDAVCIEYTQVSIGAAGAVFVNATSFNNGSQDNCSDVYFKARRMDPNGCQPNNRFYDQVKFCCEDIGDTITVVLRVYDVTVEPGEVALGYRDDYVNECMVQVYVDDKLKPVCYAPANVTVSCEAFDPSLWAYGFATATDNCCLDTITESRNLSQFDTLCNRGTITRTFRAIDCIGNSSTCTQRIFVNYNQFYNIEFPGDRVVFTCDGTTAFGEPRIDKKDCELIAVSYEDQIFNVVPDACFKIERTWTVINWCTYNPNVDCIYVPNPNPNPLPNHPQNLASVFVSAPGTPAPWTATQRALVPGGPVVDFSTIWQKEANCYQYKQIIKVIDNEDPTATDVLDDCDFTANDPNFWNSMDWWDPIHGTHDLCEAPVNINITGFDSCVGRNLTAYALIFLDLDGDGYMETVLNSNTFPTLPAGFINYNNAANPSYTGGISRQFDFRPVPSNLYYRFAMRVQDLANGTRRFSIQWTDRTNPNPNNNNDWTLPQIPLGKHKIKWVVTDMCGNETVKDRQWDLHDCKPPTVVCLHGLSANIMPTGMLTIWGIDWLKYGEDNCTPANQLVYSIRKAGTGTGFPLDANGNPIPGVTFTCNELGDQLVELWARDARGNAAYCETYIQVQDPFDNCNQSPKATVAGALKTEKAEGLEDADVQITGTSVTNSNVNQTVKTDDQGAYINPNVPVNANLTVTPSNDNNPLNGVTTYDLLLMSRHILGVTPLTSAYQMIAADVNKSGSVTTNDIVELRKLILGIYTDLPQNTSWRFVDKSFAFPNVNNPFQAPGFPESKSLQNFAANAMDQDFVSIKVGDINGNAVANSAMSTDDRSNGTSFFDAQDATVKAGEEVVVNFKAAEKMEGFQFTMNLKGLEIVDVLPGANMTAQNFAVFAKEGALTASVDGNAGEFAVKFRASKAGKISEMITVSNRITKAEAYSVDGSRNEVAFRFNGENGSIVAGAGFELFQNTPNPVANVTQITFNLPEAANATLTISNVEGRVIKTINNNFAKGLNTVSLNRSDLQAGVLFYQLDANGNTATKKMIVID